MSGEEASPSDDMLRVDPQRASQLVTAATAIQQAVKAACGGAGRTSAPPRLVAVSKLKPASDVLALHESSLGLVHFGENYLNELEQKARVLPRSVRWHFIGGLQSNKCKPLAQGVPNLWAVESVDTSKKADQLDKGRAALLAGDDGADVPADEQALRVFVQVNTSGESEKSGVEPGDDALALCRHIREKCQHLRLHGLMTIGAIARSHSGGENEDFVALRNERAKVAKGLGIDESELELSMGMSADFEEAIRQGSDEVMFGSQIFGARPPKKAST